MSADRRGLCPTCGHDPILTVEGLIGPHRMRIVTMDRSSKPPKPAVVSSEVWCDGADKQPEHILTTVTDVRPVFQPAGGTR